MSDYKLKLQQVKVQGRRPSSRTHGSQFAGGRIERRTPGKFGHCLVRECFKGLSAFLLSFFSVFLRMTLSHDKVLLDFFSSLPHTCRPAACGEQAEVALISARISGAHAPALGPMRVGAPRDYLFSVHSTSHALRVDLQNCCSFLLPSLQRAAGSCVCVCVCVLREEVCLHMQNLAQHNLPATSKLRNMICRCKSNSCEHD